VGERNSFSIRKGSSIDAATQELVYPLGSAAFTKQSN